MTELLTFIGGAIIGWFGFQLMLVWKVKRLLAKPEVVKAIEPPKINVDFSRINNRVYAYNKDTSAFLAYGESKQEIIDELNKRFPGISFMANALNMKEVGFNE